MTRTNSALVLAALALGIAAGAACQAAGTPELKSAVELAEAFGGLWLNALRMTIVPLVFALLVVGIASVADAAATGKLAAKAIGLFCLLLILAALYAVAASKGLLALWPLDPEGAKALLAGAKAQGAEIPETPGFGDWLRGLAPANPVKAAAEGEILPLVVFGVFFGFAAAALPERLRQSILTLFQAVGEAMVTIVRWVLVVAPLGVFALSLGVGLRVGFGSVGILIQYVIIVSLATIGVAIIAFVIGVVFGKVSPARFATASAPVLAVAFSTQSSLACLPVMVETARDRLGIAQRVTGLVLPLAVAVFRMTSPVANLAVCFFVAALYGLEPSLLNIAAAVLVAFAISVGSVGLPGQISFFASVAPICIALGVPIEILPILLAVEVVPDIFRTVGNVTADLAATAILGRGETDDPVITAPMED